MFRKLSKYLCFSMITLIAACAPRPIVPVPELYREELSLHEILSKVGRDIDVLKAITEITIQKNNEPYDVISAAVLMKKPGWIHMRVYKFGILVNDIIMKDDMLYVKSGKKTHQLGQLSRELYNAVFWWNDLDDGSLSVGEQQYMIRKPGRRIHLEKATLLPLKQHIALKNNDIILTYSVPKENNGFWYQSTMMIHIEDFHFIVDLKKVIKNPALQESDFAIPLSDSLDG